MEVLDCLRCVDGRFECFCRCDDGIERDVRQGPEWELENKNLRRWEIEGDNDNYNKII